MKQIVTNYSFSVSAKTITLSDFGASHPVDLKRLYLITDVTTNKILYNFADSTVATAAVSGNNVITLSTLQGGEANSDAIQIVYEVLSTDPTYEIPLLSANAAQETGGNLASVSTSASTIAGAVSASKMNVNVSSGTVTDNIAADATFTITLASLASSTAGVGRQSTLISNATNLYSSALVYVLITVGTSPTANTPIYVYLICSNADATYPVADDGAGSSDAGITIVNASLLGVITCSAATSNATYSAHFDTSTLGPLGPKWGIAVVNSTGVALNATASNQIATYVGITKSL